MLGQEKPIAWIGSAYDDLCAFPDAARRVAGHELHQVQAGLMPSNWKPMSTVGPGRKEEIMKIGHVTSSGGNIFQDLGFGREEAENLKIRSEIMIAIRRIVEQRGLKQTEAADLFGTTQPRISDLMRGKIDQFTIDTLVNMLSHAGVHVELRLDEAVAVRGPSGGEPDVGS